MRILLDSNAYIQLMQGRPEVTRVVRDAGEILMSSVVLGELLYGFRAGSRTEANLAELRVFLDNPYVSPIAVGPVTADRYARVSVSLRTKGRPIPSNDVWIAAHALETGADLVSADRHFEHVAGIAWTRIPPRRPK